ncbi:MAG: hypothetical protein N3D81_04740 [Spirochaetes bacterium]|nr:hypothetical protein [Spirochaetota bacterium]
MTNRKTMNHFIRNFLQGGLRIAWVSYENGLFGILFNKNTRLLTKFQY